MKKAQRDRAASGSNSREFDYLRDEVANRLVERLLDVSRKFPHAADVGCNTGNLAKALVKLPSNEQARVGIQSLAHYDHSGLCLLSLR